jgi:heme/copper-type cytochrome/quinol oxidase subunit 1
MTFIPLFWVSFSGLPRRLHDFPAVFTGWQSMATVGHFITLLGVCCFYFMLFDAHRHGKTATTQTLSIPRFNKRVLYYVYKVTQIQLHSKQFKNLPTVESRLSIIRNLTHVI